MSKKENGDIRCADIAVLSAKLRLFYCAYGTLCSTGTAAYACILVDRDLAVAFSDSAYRALSCAGTARNTTIFDNKCHDKYLLCISRIT